MLPILDGAVGPGLDQAQFGWKDVDDLGLATSRAPASENLGAPVSVATASSSDRSGKEPFTAVAGLRQAWAFDDLVGMMISVQPPSADPGLPAGPCVAPVAYPGNGITADDQLWWFGGEDAHCYSESVTLSVDNPEPGTYNWTIVHSWGGEAPAVFSNGKYQYSGDSSVEVQSIGPSNPDDFVSTTDIIVTAVSASNTVSRINLISLSPHSLQHLANHDVASATWGYETHIHYRILDQFGNELPESIEVNEQWTSGVTADYAGMDWRRGDPGGATVNPADWIDQIQGETSDKTPTPLAPAGGGTKVYHWEGEWNVGSVTPGLGVKVQTNTWQKYQDHARHENIVSPIEED